MFSLSTLYKQTFLVDEKSEKTLFLLVGRKSINSGWVIIDTIKITFVAHYYILHVFWQIFKFIINLFYAAIWGSWCRMQCRKIDMYAYLWGHSTTMWTKCYLILTIYHPWVENCGKFTEYLPFSNFSCMFLNLNNFFQS